MRSETDKTKLLIKSLIAIVVVLGLIVLYLLVISPQYNNIVVNSQNRGFSAGVNYTLNSIFSSLQQQGYVSLPLGGNHTLYLVPVQPGNQSAPNTGTTGNGTQ